MKHDDFFVGYLKMPARLRRFSLVAAGVMVLVASSVAVAAGYFRSGPGPGLEPFRSGQEFVGLLAHEPYAVLRYVDLDGELRHLLLVRSGKFGAAQPARAASGEIVRLQGSLLERDGRQMLEWNGRSEHDSTLDGEVVERLRNVETESLGLVTLRGEIVDSKCYLGRMRPGGGRMHRACAQLCITGGIPPVLITRDANGLETHFLLVTTGGEPINDAVIPFVAEPVEVTGELSRTSDLLTLAIDPAAIVRL